MGSPARAGIDLSSASPIVHLLRFPRTRGDRPPRVWPAYSVRKVPPHARG